LSHRRKMRRCNSLSLSLSLFLSLSRRRCKLCSRDAHARDIAEDALIRGTISSRSRRRETRTGGLYSAAGRDSSSYLCNQQCCSLRKNHYAFTARVRAYATRIERAATNAARVGAIGRQLHFVYSRRLAIDLYISIRVELLARCDGTISTLDSLKIAGT